MANRSALIKEIDTLSPSYYGEIIEFIGYLKEKNTRKHISMERAADMAAEEYHSNRDLTSFCAIDGEDFYEAR